MQRIWAAGRCGDLSGKRFQIGDMTWEFQGQESFIEISGLVLNKFEISWSIQFQYDLNDLPPWNPWTNSWNPWFLISFSGTQLASGCQELHGEVYIGLVGWRLSDHPGDLDHIWMGES
jgi:hypothetical protein